MTRILFLLLLTTVQIVTAASHPTWWTYVSPDATAVIGIRWETLKNSVFADAIGAELSSAGELNFPDIECLRQASQILIAAPPMMAVASGNFSTAAIRKDAVKKSWKEYTYRGVTLWKPANARAMGVALIDERTVVVGAMETLQDAIDRSQADTRLMSPLLERAAKFSATGDLWVVAAQLPDALASVFVPIDTDAINFEGELRAGSGLGIDASFHEASADAASEAARQLVRMTPQFPAVARGLKVTPEGDTVSLTLDVTSEQLAQNLASPDKPAAPPPAQVTLVTPTSTTRTELPAAPPPPTPTAPTAPEQPGVIRILGLDDGPREIPFPPKTIHY